MASESRVNFNLYGANEDMHNDQETCERLARHYLLEAQGRKRHVTMPDERNRCLVAYWNHKELSQKNLKQVRAELEAFGVLAESSDFDEQTETRIHCFLVDARKGRSALRDKVNTVPKQNTAEEQ